MQEIDEKSLVAASKPELIILDTPELNAETPPHLLDDDITPISRLFARNTGVMPVLSDRDLADWSLTIDGFVKTPKTWTLKALRGEFETVTQAAVIECAGNGRAFFTQPTSTVMWQHGAVGCPQWTGVRLADLLKQCGVLPEAVYTAHHSPDRAIEGEGAALSRGVPIAKALAPETLVAYAINGEPLPPLHGGPLRIVAPGFPGAAWQKWLARIEIRDRVHDGPKMTGLWYRMPRTQMNYGEQVDELLMEPITDMPVKSVITFPQDGFSAPAGRPLTVRGQAWSGHVPLPASRSRSTAAQAGRRRRSARCAMRSPGGASRPR